MRGVRRYGVPVAVLLGLYTLLVAQFAWAELGAGVLTAVLAVVALGRLRRLSPQRFAVRPAMLWRVAGVVGQVVPESLAVLAAAFRPVPEGGLGRSVTVPFAIGTGLPPAEEAARRALVVGALCFSPDSVVVLRERAGSPAHLVVHQLVSRALPGRGDPAWPV